MAGVVSVTIGFAAPIALTAMAFGKYFQGTFGAGSPVLLSFVIVWIVAFFHFGNLRTGSVPKSFDTCKTASDVRSSLRIFRGAEANRLLLPMRADAMSIFGAPFAVALVYDNSTRLECSRLVTGKSSSRVKSSTLIVHRHCQSSRFMCSSMPSSLATTPEQEMRGQIEVALIAGKYIFERAVVGLSARSFRADLLLRSVR